MRRLMAAILAAVVLVPVTALRAQDDQKTEAPPPAKQKEAEDATPQTPAEQMQAVMKEYQDANSAWMAAAREASKEGKPVDMTTRPNPQDFVAKVMALVEANPKEPAAADALYWVANTLRQGDVATQAVELLFKNHPESDKIAPACMMLAYNVSKSSEGLLREVMKTNTQRQVQANACYALANLLKRAEQLAGMLDNEERAKQIENYYGKEMVAYLKAKDPKATKTELEQLFATIVEKYADVPGPRGTLGASAEAELFEIRFLAVGCVAPDIEGEDIDATPFKLSDYRGKVVMIDFWGDW